MLKDAEAWARQTEIQADRHELPSDRKALTQVSLGDLVAEADVTPIWVIVAAGDCAAAHPSRRRSRR